MPMETLTVTLKTVTPLFLGGAEPHERAELRAPSIKGAMRFWYRAFDYTDANEENAIFGSADTGQGIFDIRITTVVSQIEQVEVFAMEFDQKVAYLGYGLIERKKINNSSAWKNARPFIDSGTTYEVKITFKPVKNDSPEHEKAKVIEYRKKAEGALWAMLMFSGLGSRSRRGFGSLAVTAIEGASSLRIWNFANAGVYKTALESFIQGLKTHSNSDPSTHTSWSRNKAQCVVLGKGKEGNGDITPFSDWKEALKWIGTELHKYRSYHPAPPTGERNFKNDHDNVCDYLLNGSKPPSLPRRAAFGLPHNYFFTNSFNNYKGRVPKNEFNQINGSLLTSLISGGIVQNSDPNFVFFNETRGGREHETNLRNQLTHLGLGDHIDKIIDLWKSSLKGSVDLNLKDDRRASPFILHIQELKDGKACMTATFMPAKFIPDGKSITIETKFFQNQKNLSFTDFTAVENFMNRLARKGVEIK